MLELQKRKMEYMFIHTGQHLVKDLVKELDIRSPDFSIAKLASKRGNFDSNSGALIWNLKLLFKIKKILNELKPSVALVHGDTMTTTTATVAAKLVGIKVGHIEAGLRSGNIFEPWPEELSRRITDCLSNYLFAPTKEAAERLHRINFFGRKQIVLTGNTNIDVLKENIKKIRRIKGRKYVFAKLHRQENIKSKLRMETFLKVISSIDAPVEFVIVENTRKKMEKYGLDSYLKNTKNIRLHNLLSYKEFLNMFANASLIISDGGGEIEEATYLHIPILSFRKYSERKEADKHGFGISTISFDKAVAYAKNVMNGTISSKGKCPFGDGTASERIVNFLSKL